MRRIVSQSDFSAGWATSKKKGAPHSFAYSKGLDFRKDPNILSFLPRAAKESGTVITDLPVDACRLPNGKIYIVGSTGNIYVRDAAGSYSLFGSLGESSGYSIVYRQDIDVIYIAGRTRVGIIKQANTSPVLSANQYIQNLDTSTTGGAQTYTAPVALSEAAGDQFSYTPTIEPLYSVKLRCVTAGTGTWTLTMHDGENNILGTASLTPTSGTQVEFVFSTPIRMLVKPNARTYHFHLTSTVADGTVQTATAANFSNPDRELYGSRLISTQNGFHPMILFLQYLLIGNERYVTAFEPLAEPPSNSNWQRHRLTLPPGYEITSFAVYEEKVAIAAERRGSDSSHQFQDGKIFFWDGLSGTYNYFKDVPEGSPYSLFVYKGVLYCVAGGALWAYNGGQLIKIRQLPNTDSEYTDMTTYVINYPNTVAVRNSIMLLGFPSETTNQTIEHGVYSFGVRDKDHPYSFGFSYPISTGTLLNNGSNNLRVGLVKSFGDTLLIGWRDDSQPAGSRFGMDVVNNNSDPAPSVSWESLRFDNNLAYKDKQAIGLLVTHDALPTGTTITNKYRFNRATSWTNGVTSTAGATETRFNFSTARQHREIEFGFDGTCTGTTTPNITSIALLFDDQSEEKRFGA